MEEIIDGARDSLIIVGTTPLFEFAKKPDVLIKRFQQLKSVTIAYLASDSKYVRSREVQAGDLDGTSGELHVHGLLIQQLKNRLRGGNVKFIAYDLPPAEFFYICDERMLLANWYPFGESGVRCPCIFVDNLQRNQNSERLLSHYLLSLDFIVSNSELPTELPAQARSNSARRESRKRSKTDRDDLVQ